MNDNARILYVCQEVFPYLPENEISNLCRYLPQAMQERGAEIRIFMPKWGCINERRNQLHEVIRLSGMNLIIDDTDHQLIIKVASIPSARVQVYFIDNDDFFKRKATWMDPARQYFEDNEERAIFFARGVLETVRKLGWTPNVVHCHDWFSAIVPIYLRKIFHKDPIFKDLRIVVSVYEHAFSGSLNRGLKEKLKEEGIAEEDLEGVGIPDYRHLMQFAIEHADAVVIGSEGFGRSEQTRAVAEYISGLKQARGTGRDRDKSEKLVLDYPGDCGVQGGGLEQYEAFYRKLLEDK